MVLTPGDVLGVAGASIVVTIIVQSLIAAWSPTAAQKDRFGPFLALATGVAVVCFFAATQGQPMDAAVLTGIIAGASAMGIHDTVDSVGDAVR
jgi:hypothetical protein